VIFGNGPALESGQLKDYRVEIRHESAFYRIYRLISSDQTQKTFRFYVSRKILLPQ